MANETIPALPAERPFKSSPSQRPFVSGQLTRTVVSDKVTSTLLGLYFILKPFYVFESGLPQPADFVMALLFVVLPVKFLISFRGTISISRNARRALLLALSLAAYVVMVNGVWTVFLADATIFYSVFWYIYNVLVLLTIMVLYETEGETILRVICISVALSVTVQLAALLVGYAEIGGRATQFFNNPNQLGYYGLLCLAILVSIQDKLRINRVILYWVIIAGFLLIIASLSKAAILSAVLLFLAFAYKNRHSRQLRRINVVLLLAVVLLSVAASQENNDNLINAALERVASIGSDSDDSLAGRGYDRIWTSPEYLIFGAGEGAYDRFDSQISGSELHASLGNMLVSYGVIGFSMLLVLIFWGIKKQGLWSYYPMFFILLYGLTHNGIRHTFFWILLAIVHMEMRPRFSVEGSTAVR